MLLDILRRRSTRVHASLAGAHANSTSAERLRPLPFVGPKITLRNVFIGTTGLCNASCVHCPTGKEDTAHFGRAPMSMDLFRSIIDQISQHGGHKGFMSFGLWGDGLVDPFVVERTKYARARLPDMAFCLNSNGAAYNSRKHAELVDKVTFFGLHVESLVEETYDYLMAPLRLRNVKPKIEQILRDFPKKVFVSIPLSKANFAERDALDAWFRERGAATVLFHGLFNRCSPSTADVFEKLSFNPAPLRCPTEMTTDLVVDWEGDVYLCCNDFLKRVKLGDLSKQTLEEIMNDARRHEHTDLLREGRHSDIASCKHCVVDMLSDDQRTAASQRAGFPR